MLIDYLTFNYMFAYFWFAIFMLSVFDTCVFEANIREKLFFYIFSSKSSSSVWNIQTNLFLSPDARGLLI